MDPSTQSSSIWTQQFTIVNDESVSSEKIRTSSSNSLYNDKSVSLTGTSPSTIEIVLSNSDVFYSSPNVNFYYRLRNDFLYDLNVFGTSVNVYINCGSTMTQTTSCTTSNSVRSCSFAVSTSWFSTSVVRSCTMRAEITTSSSLSASSLTETFNLQIKPVYDTRNSGGIVWATFATSPVFPSETITMTFYAHTNSLSAAAFDIIVLFDESVLEYVSSTASSSFTSPTVLYTANYESGYGRIGAAQALTENFVTGDSITLITLTFRVVPSPSSYGALAECVDFVVSNFYANNQQNIVSPNTVGMIDDYIGTSSKSRMMLYKKHVVGILSTPATGEMINLNVFSLSSSSLQSDIAVTVKGIYSDGTSASLSNTYLTCTSSNIAVVQTTPSCGISFSGSETLGSSNVSISVM
jgi:hypothetical protein